MKVIELMEADLDSTTRVLELMHHGKLTKHQAVELEAKLSNIKFFLTGNVFKTIRAKWVEDKNTSTLRLVASGLPGSWRSGTAAMTRGKIADWLREYGFKVARWPSHAKERVEDQFNGPQIYFWGEGTDEGK